MDTTLPPTHSRWRVASAIENLLLPIFVLLVGWTLSGWIFLLLQGNAARRQEEFFGERVAEAQESLRVRMTSYADALRGGASFFAASSTVRRDDWRVYAESLQLKKRYPGINGIGVIFVVPRAETTQWFETMRADGAPNMKLSPFPATTASPEDPQYIIAYVEPIGTNSVSLGRNIATEPTRRAAAEAARDSGEVQMHRRAEGSRDMQHRSGLLLYQPLYAKGAFLGTIEARRAAHLGWIYAQIFPDIFLQGFLGPTGNVLQLHVFETGSLTRERLLYASDGSTGEHLPRFDRVTQLDLAGQRFQLAWRRGPRFPPLEKSPAFWAAGGCAVATFLLAGLIMSLQSTGRRAFKIAAERTGELAASEERFRQAFELAGIGMAIVSLDGRWLRVNKALCDIVGYGAAELLQKKYQDITHRDDVGGNVAVSAELVDGSRRSYQVEKRYIHRHGHIVWVRLTVSLVRDARSQPLHFISQMEDITSAKQLEENLARARDAALEASRLKSEFLATVSHEIRTPMNGVMGMTALLRDTTLTPTQAEHVAILESSGELLLTIINGILDYSKIEAGRMEIEATAFDVPACVQAAVDLFASRAQLKKIGYQCTIAPGVPARAVGDPMRLRQVLVNLLDNAIKFTERGEITVTVHAEPIESGTSRQRLHFAVRDTGVGIAPEAMHRLFKSFSQVDATTTRRFGGTGLGLVISKRLSELMGGTMWVTSQPGAGSIFYFTVQVEPQAPATNKPAAPSSSLQAEATLADRCPLRLLMAEDNPVNHRVAMLLLQRMGYQITVVANGREAVTAVESGDFDAVLMDVEMPELDGCEATRRIRILRNSKTQPWIVALTASATQDDRERAFAAGMNDFLTKPVRSEALAASLSRAFEELRKMKAPPESGG